MTRECHVRFCERLGVRLPGATLPTETQRTDDTELGERIAMNSSIEKQEFADC